MGSRAAFARIAPFAAFILFIALAPLVEGRLDDRWWVVARGLAVAVLLAFFWRQYSELRVGDPPREREHSGSASPLGEGRGGGPSSTVTNLVLSVVVGLVVFLAWITFDSGWAKIGRDRPFVPLRADGSLDPLMIGLRLFGLALVVPVMEELFWRSFLMRWIDKRDFLAADPRQASLMAFALSSALFASEHAQWFAGLLAGLAYAWLYRRTGNLWHPILSHAITNGTLGIWILATRQWHYW